MIFWFQVVSGAAFGWYLDFFFGYLETSFVDDFEKVIVFVRCGNSPQTSCSLVTDIDGGIEHSSTHNCYLFCQGSMSCPYVIFHGCKFRLFCSRLFV